MKKLFIILSVLALSITVYGQSAKDIIDKYSEIISSYECLYATYNFSISGKEGNTKFAIDGEFYTQDDKFLVKTYFSDIYCNGEYKAIHDKSVQEVAIIGHNRYDANISDNPFAVLKNGPFAYTFGDEAESLMFGDQECWRVTLIPKSENADHTSVAITVSKSDYSVKNIEYQAKSGDKYIALVKSISEAGGKEPAFFEFDSKGMPDVVVNDLR